MRILPLRQLADAAARPAVLAPILVVIALFKLAISDGGRDLPSLTLAQVVIFLLLGGVVWTGAMLRPPVTRALVGMVAAVAVTSLWSVRPEASVRQALLWTMYLGLTVVPAATLRDATAARRVLDALVAIAGWLCLIALFMFWGADTPGMRWYSTFYWPNPFAAFLLLVYPLAVVRLVHAGTVRDALVDGATALFLGAALVLTFSRGAWLALAAVAPVGLAVLRPRRWSAAGLRIGLLTVATLLAVVLLTRGTAVQSSPQGVVGRAASVADLSDYAIRGRLHFWRTGIDIFADHPIVGTGPGTFGAVAAAYQGDARYYARDAHNLYIQTAAEMGLAGLAALALLLATTARVWLRTLRAAQGREEYPLIAGVGLGLTAFVIHSGVDMNWMFPADPALAFILIGVLAWYDRAREPGAAAAPVPRKAPLWQRGLIAAALAVAVAGVAVLRLAQGEFAAAQDAARNGQWTAAVAGYRGAARWNPLHAGYLSALATALVRAVPSNPDAAIETLRQAQAVDRMNAAIPLQMAAVLIDRSGNDPTVLREAEAMLQVSLALDAWNRPQTYGLLARLYLRQGRQDEADRVYRAAMARYVGRDLGKPSLIYPLLWPQVVGLFMDAAEASVQRGDRIRATQILEALLAEDPNVAPAVVRLSEIYIAMDRRADARTLLLAAAVRMPDDPLIAAALAQTR